MQRGRYKRPRVLSITTTGDRGMDPQQLREAALYYHRNPKPGKIAVTPI